MIRSLSLTSPFSDAPFYERFSLARQAGFDWVELSAWDDLDLSRITNELNDNELKLTSIGGSCHDTLMDPTRQDEFLEFLSQSIAVAKSLQCTNVIIESGLRHCDSSTAARRHFAADINRAGRVLKDAAKKTLRHAITLYLRTELADAEGLYSADRVAQSLEMIAIADSPAVRILPDLTNSRDPAHDLAAVQKSLSGRLEYINVKYDAISSGIGRLSPVLSTLRYDGIVGYV